MVGAELARGLDAYESDSLRTALAGDAPLRYPLHPLHAADADANAEGPLLGGCLSLLTAVLGTPWATPFDDALLFIEDVNEPLHRVDRMLTHLRLSGSLTGVRGVIAGHFGREWEQAIRHIGSAETGGAETRLAAAWHRETVLALPGPLAVGLPCGHGTPNLTLPLGAYATLDARNAELVIDPAR